MRKLNRLLQNVGLGTEKTIENYDFSFYSSFNAAYIRELAICRFIEKGEGILLLESIGTGIIHIGQLSSQIP